MGFEQIQARIAREARQGETSSTTTAVSKFLGVPEATLKRHAEKRELVFDLADCRNFQGGQGAETVCIRSGPLLKSWTPEDDDVQGEDDEIKLLQLEADIATCIENMQELHEMVVADQAGIDQIEALTQQTRTHVEECVEVLTQTREEHSRPYKWILPVVGGLALGAAIPISAPVGGLIVAKVGIVGAGAAATGGIQNKVKKLRKTLTETMQSNTLAVSSPLKAEEKLKMVAFGDEAMHRFTTALRGSWHRMYGSWKANTNGFNISYGESGCRSSGIFRKGYAYMVEFEISVTPKAAFRELLRMQACVSVDPGCQFSWDMPVQGRLGRDQDTCSLRFMGFQRALFSRCCFTISSTTEETMTEGGERYLIASASPPSEIIPEQYQHMSVMDQEAHCHYMGIIVEGIGGNRCRIRVAADVDPRMRHIGGNRQADHVVRTRLVDTAKRLRIELSHLSQRQSRGSVTSSGRYSRGVNSLSTFNSQYSSCADASILDSTFNGSVVSGADSCLGFDTSLRRPPSSRDTCPSPELSHMSSVLSGRSSRTHRRYSEPH
jgi:hypothetical protein